MIYIIAVILIINTDAMICIAVKHKFNFWHALPAALAFPVVLPINIWFIHSNTKDLDNASNLIYSGDEDEKN